MDVHHGFTPCGFRTQTLWFYPEFFLILRAVSGYGGIMKSFVLENPVTAYIGRISYGLYFNHNFVYNFYHTNYPTHPTALNFIDKLQQFAPSITHRFAFWALGVCYAHCFDSNVVLVSLKPVNNLKNTLIINPKGAEETSVLKESNLTFSSFTN